MVVTKTFPAADVVRLVELGVRDVGENRDQDAAAKVVETAATLGRAQHPPRWHFVGQLQRNKAASVARYADVVHSVDRLALAQALGKGAHLAGPAARRPAPGLARRAAAPARAAAASPGRPAGAWRPAWPRTGGCGCAA